MAEGKKPSGKKSALAICSYWFMYMMILSRPPQLYLSLKKFKRELKEFFTSWNSSLKREVVVAVWGMDCGVQSLDNVWLQGCLVVLASVTCWHFGTHCIVFRECIAIVLIREIWFLGLHSWRMIGSLGCTTVGCSRWRWLSSAVLGIQRLLRPL